MATDYYAERWALRDAVNSGVVHAWMHGIPIEYAKKEQLIAAAFGTVQVHWNCLQDVPDFTDPQLCWRIPEELWDNLSVSVGDVLPEVFRVQHKVRKPGWTVRVGRPGDIVSETMAEFHEYQVLRAV